MPNILDIYDDTSLHGAVNSLRENPEYYDDVAKTQIDYEDKQNLPPHAFAWPEERAYPINGRSMAILSSLYRNSQPPEMDGVEVPEHVDQNLEKAAYLYNFKMPKRKVKQAEKVASLSDADYLLPSEKKFPVRNVKEAKFIQSVIAKNAHIMGYDHLAEACTNLTTKMAEYKVDLKEVSPIVAKYAGLTLSNKEVLEAAILRRIDFCAPKYRDSYYKVAEMMEEMDFNRINLLKLASTLEKVDKEASLRHLYDKHVMNPIESVFNTMKIRQPSAEKTAGHDLFSLEMASSVSPELVKEALGDDVYQEASGPTGLDRERLYEVVNSLPTDMINDFVHRIA